MNHHCCCTEQYVRHSLWPIPHFLVGIRVRYYLQQSKQQQHSYNTKLGLLPMLPLYFAGKVIAFIFFTMYSIGNLTITQCCCTEKYARYFRRAIPETLRVLTDSIWGIKIHKCTAVCRTDGSVNVIYTWYAIFVFNQVRSRVWDGTENEHQMWRNLTHETENNWISETRLTCEFEKRLTEIECTQLSINAAGKWEAETSLRTGRNLSNEPERKGDKYKCHRNEPGRDFIVCL